VGSLIGWTSKASADHVCLAWWSILAVQVSLLGLPHMAEIDLFSWLLNGPIWLAGPAIRALDYYYYLPKKILLLLLATPIHQHVPPSSCESHKD